MSSGEVHDVLSFNDLDKKIMGDTWGGLTLYQIQNQLYRGVGKLHAGAKASPSPDYTFGNGCHRHKQVQDI